MTRDILDLGSWCITVGQLRELVAYEPLTGAMTWKARSGHWFTKGRFTGEAAATAWNRKYEGKPALSSPSGAYLGGVILTHAVSAHRAAWALHHGEWPKGQIDHINGDGRDNRIENLRDVPPVGNARNRKMNRRNASGVSGVWRAQTGDAWVASIGGRGVRKYLGQFRSFDEAVAARKRAEAEFDYHPNHGRVEAAG